MKNEQILKKAFKKVIKNGFDPSIFDAKGDVQMDFENALISGLHYGVIFNHDFAKAFWGEPRSIGNQCKNELNAENNYICCEDIICIREIIEEGWQSHLEEMVLRKDPLKYLEKFL